MEVRKDVRLVVDIGDAMNDERKNTKRKLKEIPKLSTFNEILEQSTLTDLEKEIVRMHYLKKIPIEVIGDLKGYSKSAIMRMHKIILNKLSKIL